MISRKDAKLRLIRLLLLLQEFDLDTIHKKCMDNKMSHHLSSLLDEVDSHDNLSIKYEFLGEQLQVMSTIVTPWNANIVIYLASGYVPSEFNYQQRKRFFHAYKIYMCVYDMICRSI